MSPRFTFFCVALVASVATANACDNCKKNAVFGKPIVMGNGIAYSWANLDPKTKKPISMGVTLTETALEGLPGVETMNPKMPMMEMTLEVPAPVKGLPYDHITIDWNPIGHEPAKIYDKAHFDVHFYTISPAARKKITVQGADIARSRKTPAPGIMAAGYILPPKVEVPMMGSHWIDPTSRELRGEPFTSTFIYGTYNGKLTFLEPMIALSYLQEKPQFEKKIAVPKKVAQRGYYPNAYKVGYDPVRKEYNIVLSGLALKG
jgi:hypothetical protein